MQLLGRDGKVHALMNAVLVCIMRNLQKKVHEQKYFLLTKNIFFNYNRNVKMYKEQLNKNKVQYKILSEETQADGSVIIEIKKQYNSSPTGNYMD